MFMRLKRKLSKGRVIMGELNKLQFTVKQVQFECSGFITIMMNCPSLILKENHTDYEYFHVWYKCNYWTFAVGFIQNIVVFIVKSDYPNHSMIFMCWMYQGDSKASTVMSYPMENCVRRHCADLTIPLSFLTAFNYHFVIWSSDKFNHVLNKTKSVFLHTGPSLKR